MRRRHQRFGPNPVCYAGRFLFSLGLFALLVLLGIGAALIEQTTP